MKKSTAPSPKKSFPQRKGPPSNKQKTKKNPPIQFKAPSDFKPHFLLLSFITEKDGLLGGAFRATRYQGRFDRDVEDKKKFDLGSYDSKTLMAIQGRISSVTYKNNVDKRFPIDIKNRDSVKGAHRLPASTQFQVLMRIGKRSADQTLTVGVKQIWQIVDNGKGRQVLKDLEYTDPVYRAIRKSSRVLPAAFREVQIPPKRSRSGKSDSDED